jgi:formylglycine-generating enzyme required for sulfatase activity
MNIKKDEDILKDVFRGIKGPEILAQPHDDFDESSYRKWVAEETGYIDIRGIGGGRGKAIAAIRFPIMKLYTELHVRSGITNFDLQTGHGHGLGQRRPLTDLARATRCLVIVGDPGSGKTTFLRFLANTELLSKNGRLPCYIRLSDLYDFAVSSNLHLAHQIFIEYLLDLSKRENFHVNRVGLEKRARSGRLMWLLDGLDELPSSGSRESIVRAIENASRTWNDCHFIITSRPLAVTGKAVPIDFEVVGIDQMQDDEIKSFLDVWTSLLFTDINEDARKKYSASLYQSIRDNPAIRNLARNPVMLTCMAVVHYNERHLPEGRADLFEAVIQWLIRAREQFADLGPSTIEDMYRKIALAMFKAEGGPRYRVGLLNAAEIIKHHFNGSSDRALDFLRLMEIKTGILVRRGEGDIAFWHSSLQNYLVAKEIAGKTDDEETGWWSEIRDNLDKYEWREVLCLFPACLMRLGTDRVDLFFRRISESIASANLLAKAKRAGLGGCVLSDLRVYDYSARNVSAWNGILNDVPIFTEATKIPLSDRFNAAVAYGLGGDPRLRDFEETWVKIIGGNFWMGAQAKDSKARNFDPYATDWEGPVTKVSVGSFEMRKYPITVEEFIRFIDDCGYKDSAEDFWSPKGWQWRCRNNISGPKNIESQSLVPNCPITFVSWFEAEAYANWLSKNDPRNLVYRLPSEAEWEYVARHGNMDKRFPWGDNISRGDLAEANWFGCNLNKVSPVGLFPKSNTTDNVTDMIGNAEEWCADSWSESHAGYNRNGRARAIVGEERKVVRGGSTIRVSRLCRPTYRSRCSQGNRYATIGFRLVRVELSLRKKESAMIGKRQQRQ